MDAAIGQGIGQGLQNATNTLLQIQMYKQQKAQQAQQDKIKDKYDDSRAKYEDMMVDNMAKSSDSYIKQVQSQAVQDYLAKNGGQGDQSGGSNGQGNASGSSPVGFMSSGGAPASTIPQTYQIPNGRGGFNTKTVPQDPFQKESQMEDQITNKVMNSKPGDVNYDTAHDAAFGKLSINELNHLAGGMGQQSRVKLQAMMQLAKKINPDFNETMLENSQAGLRARITSLDRQAGLIGQAVNRVDKFGNIALSYSDKVNRTKYPILNNADYLWNTNVMQDDKVSPDIKSFIDSTKLLSVDWARATTGQTGGAAVSDSARKEFGDLISASDSSETFKKLIDLAKTDTQASKKSYSDAKDQSYQEYQDQYGNIGNTGKGDDSFKNLEKGNTPAVGTIDGGYKFKGGDPSDQNNWEKS